MYIFTDVGIQNLKNLKISSFQIIHEISWRFHAPSSKHLNFLDPVFELIWS